MTGSVDAAVTDTPPAAPIAADAVAGAVSTGARKTLLTAIVVLVLAAAVVAVAALAFGGARWGGGYPTLEWNGDRFAVAGGSAVTRGGALVIQATDPNGAFVAVQPNVALDAEGYVAIDIEQIGLTEAQPVAVFWRTRLGGSRTFSHPATVSTRGGVRANLAGDPNWKGPVYGVGVIVTGNPPRGAALLRVRAISASVGPMLQETLRSWLGVETWTNQSINVVFLGGQYQAFPFALFMGLATLVAVLAWIAWKRRADLRTLALGVLVIAATGWLVLDLRWLVNLALVEARTSASLAGKSWRDARIAADDGALFAFIERARERIGQAPGRVFFSSDDAWMRVRGGYHLLPLNTLAIIYHRNLFEAERYRPGDWICFYLRHGVAYDAASKQLSWDGARPVKAERVMNEGPGALYRVLP